MTDARRFFLLGHGIAYSASPAMMSAAFRDLELPHSYALRDVAPADVASAIQELRSDPQFGGANVTKPHKAAVSDLIDELAPGAARAGAVNTIVRDADRLVGYNTDVPAIAAAVRRIRPGEIRCAAILGAGGAARGVQLALAECGVDDVVTIQRSDGTWSAMAAVLADVDIVVNATPIGTGSDDSPIRVELLRPDLAVLDLVYRPSPTRLVRNARAAAAAAEAGAGILLDQGALSLERWLGVAPPCAAMAAALRAELGAEADVAHAMEPVHA